MDPRKESLLRWIEEDRDKLIDFLSRFIQMKSPNPPGDTREATDFVCRFLDAHHLPYRVIAPHPETPNIVAAFENGSPGRHLVLNGHIDVFPVDEQEQWDYGPWSGAVIDGKVFGRGACDMKCGTTASIFTFYYLHRLRDQLRGRLTLTAVSDEETFGPWGARYLMEHHHPEVLGDCCLNGEPSSPYTIRFGEKGLLWLCLTVSTRGAHGAYTHISQSANKIAARVIHDLEALAEIRAQPPENVRSVLRRNPDIMDQALGKGAKDIVEKVTVNIGTVRGGLKVNMIPNKCTIEADFRLPIGVDKKTLMGEIDQTISRYPEVTVQEINFTPPIWCEPETEMSLFIRENVKMLKGFEPELTISLGGTDARLWRSRNVPAYVYGPSPINMGASNEYVEVKEFIHIVKTHVLSAYDYLSH
jgi:succinyl-diaminopimelate desuccinylase